MSWKAELPRAEELAAHLAGMGAVELQRLFSCVSLRLAGVPFALLYDGTLYLRVDDLSRPAFIGAGMQPFTYASRGRTVVMASYYTAPADVLEEVGELQRWCRDAYRAALAGAGGRTRRARRG
ncbi:TfoX/Sxy family protein [Burkholderia sp. FERM BP-3421]|jgi:TfoX/Sxy family transcriptional regulator of competence genes|uniref:TfoX/Sxy family protein n=1 Tax=Burkholderia sp. FERM BP-3421 TaxID=1494466 RepID=UPI00235EEDC8|nr:TfoX/Sxy family protein [Burkholderia sp. FERM BP-3421]WDD91739.1 TfoX/Sxy family protein [Burkholderia sp. FERM BP-3421]